MTGVVVDASVALKWVLEESQSDLAGALLRDAIVAGQGIVAPPILLSEATNAIYQCERRGELTAEEATGALANFMSLPVDLYTPSDLYREALLLSRRYKLSATYDAQYLVPALDSGAEFWTADRRLYNALPRSLRWVHHIADYTPDERR